MNFVEALDEVFEEEAAGNGGVYCVYCFSVAEQFDALGVDGFAGCVGDGAGDFAIEHGQFFLAGGDLPAGDLETSV